MERWGEGRSISAPRLIRNSIIAPSLNSTASPSARRTDLPQACPHSPLWETLGFRPASSIGASWSAVHYACGTHLPARSDSIV